MKLRTMQRFRNAFIKLRRKLRRATMPLLRQLSPYENLAVEYGGQQILFQGFRGDHVSHRISTTHTFYEQPMLQFVLERHGTGGTYIDAGAYIGNHTAFFAAICRADNVYAIEPNPKSFQLLQRNITSLHLSNVKPLNVAVGDQTAKARSVIVDSMNLGMNEVLADPEGDLELYSLDDIAGSQDVKLIKIDTEGWCSKVILGASDLIDRCHPVIVAEPNPESVNAIDDILIPKGYVNVAQFNTTATYIYEWQNS